MTALIASTRMYNVAPGATAAWRRLLDHVAREAEVPLDIIDHPHPATLSDLWDRPDLACAFMCGWPLAQERGHRPVLAAPVPLGSTMARYHSVFVVPAASTAETVEDTFGGIFGYNAKGSHSGWNMPQAYLATLGAHYRSELGPFGPHQRTAEAVANGEATVGALDSLVWALLQRYAPALASRVRVVGQTPTQPSPPLVGSAALSPDHAARLRKTLVGLSAHPAGAELLADVGLHAFTSACLDDYEETLTVGKPEAACSGGSAG